MEFNDKKCPIKEGYVITFYFYLGLAPIFIVGMPLNALVIIVLQRMQKRRKSNPMFLIQLLAGCDFLFMLVCFIYFPLRMTIQWFRTGELVWRQKEMLSGVEIVIWISQLYYYAMFVRNWTTVLMALERMLNIVAPLRARTWVTRARLLKIFVAFNIIALGFILPRLVTDRLVPVKDKCLYGLLRLRRKNFLIRKYIPIYLTLVFYLIGTVLVPYIILFICNIILIIALKRADHSRASMTGKYESNRCKSESKDHKSESNDHKSESNGHKSESNDHKTESDGHKRESKIERKREESDARAQNRALKMVIIVMCIFMVCESLGFVNRLLTILKVPAWDTDDVRTFVPKTAIFLSVLDSCVNFIVYFVCNERFKNAFLEMIGKGKKGSQHDSRKDSTFSLTSISETVQSAQTDDTNISN